MLAPAVAISVMDSSPNMTPSDMPTCRRIDRYTDAKTDQQIHLSVTQVSKLEEARAWKRTITSAEHSAFDHHHKANERLESSWKRTIHNHNTTTNQRAINTTNAMLQSQQDKHVRHKLALLALQTPTQPRGQRECKSPSRFQQERRRRAAQRN